MANCVTVAGWGGGVHVNGGEAHFDGTVIEDCESRRDEGALGGGVSLQTAVATLTNVVVRNNRAFAVRNRARGGGVGVDNSNVTLRNTNFTNNTAESEAGWAAGGGLSVENRRPEDGDVEAQPVHLERVIFDKTTAHSRSHRGWGGGRRQTVDGARRTASQASAARRSFGAW